MVLNFFLKDTVVVVVSEAVEASEVILVQLFIVLMSTGLVANVLLSRSVDLSIVTDISAAIDFDAGNVDFQIHNIFLTRRRA